MLMRPFFRYYGGKWRAAPRYPPPLPYRKIIEPFAGAAGYSTRYHWLDITLVEKYAVIANMWDYLIHASSREIRSIPSVEHVDDLPDWVPVPGRHLVGFWLSNAVVQPCLSLSSGRKKLALMGRKFEGWNSATKERIARQIRMIRHWKVVHGDYTSVDGDWFDEPQMKATWFIDPPYNNRAGSYYKENEIDYGSLGLWCQSRRGQVIVCENEGADWLPFKSFGLLKPGVNGKGSREVIWHREPDSPSSLL